MKFSITIPAYKQKYLYEAIESCLAQTYKDFELIIVDDASPEDIDAAVTDWANNNINDYDNPVAHDEAWLGSLSSYFDRNPQQTYSTDCFFIGFSRKCSPN